MNRDEQKKRAEEFLKEYVALCVRHQCELTSYPPSWILFYEERDDVDRITDNKTLVWSDGELLLADKDGDPEY